MEVNCKMVASKITIKVFEGRLGHKNPLCEKCGNHTYALYQGGKKEKLDDAFVCKTCSIIYKLPTPKKCELVEETSQ
jgi:hypothetical protein